MTRVFSEITTAISDKVFWLIVLATSLGWYCAPWWFVPLMAALLTLWSTISDPQWAEKFEAIGQRSVLARFWFEAFAMNVMAIGAAYAFGFAIAWMIS